MFMIYTHHLSFRTSTICLPLIYRSTLFTTCYQNLVLLRNTLFKSSRGDSAAKNLSAMKEMQIRSLGQKDLLEEGMATHSSILAWRIPWTEEPGGLQTMGSQRVVYDWIDWTRTHTPFLKQMFVYLFGCTSWSKRDLVAVWGI